MNAAPNKPGMAKSKISKAKSLRGLLLLMLTALFLAACTVGVENEANGTTMNETAAVSESDTDTETATETVEQEAEGALEAEVAAEDLDILTAVLSDEELQILGDALIAANLNDELTAAGPFTLLAPVDAAFAEVEEAALTFILENEAALADTLNNHLIVDLVDPATLAELGAALNAFGTTLEVATSPDGEVLITDPTVADTVEAQVLGDPVEAVNGFIIKIDRVLLPDAVTAILLPTPTPPPGADAADEAVEETTSAITETVTSVSEDEDAITDTVVLELTPTPTPLPEDNLSDAATTGEVTLTDMSTMDILEVVNTREDLTTLSAAIASAGLVEALDLPGPFTLFAPTDTAFEALPENTVEDLLNDTVALADTLQYHLIVGDATSAAELANLGVVLSSQGSNIDILLDSDGTILVNDAPILETIQTANGLIHLIDGLLLPPAQ